MGLTESMLDAAAPEHRSKVTEALRSTEQSGLPAWAGLQESMCDWVEDYLHQEITRDPRQYVGAHDVGGHLSIGFPHTRAHQVDGWQKHIQEIAGARREYVESGGESDDIFLDTNFYHGWPTEAEVHHEIEAFMYFLLPIRYHDAPGEGVALEAIEDVAHHIGNWVEEVPDWYDWERSEFRGRVLGTKSVGSHTSETNSAADEEWWIPEYDLEVHFRFIKVAIGAYLGNGKERYLRLAIDYADRWCDHIEAHQGRAVIPGTLLPEEATRPTRFNGEKAEDGHEYEGHLSTGFPTDLVYALQDLYRITGNERYIDRSRSLIDQHYDHGENGRPARRYSEENGWEVGPMNGEFDPDDPISGGPWPIANASLRNDLIRGDPQYEDEILAWARDIDEDAKLGDQFAISQMVAAHYYTGDPEWLERAHSMLLRGWGAVEDYEDYHICSSANRQGVKNNGIPLYQPIFGGFDDVTEGAIPIRCLQHRYSGGPGLPPGVSFRCWREESGILGFEAVNRGSHAAAWEVLPEESPLESDGVGSVTIDADGATGEGRVRIPARESIEGRIHLETNSVSDA